MASDSSVRRIVKRSANRLLGERGYAWLQAVAMARDIRSGAVAEPELALLSAVRPSETVIDVGANYGFWAVPMARAVGSRGRVLAFEPVPFTVAALRRVLRLLRVRNVDVRAVACSDAPGTLALRVPVQGTGAISAGQAHFAGRDDDRAGHEQHVRWPESRLVSCEVVRLDDVVPRDADVSLIKCDVEGAELQVLEGAAALLARCKPIVVAEINPWFLEGFELSVPVLLDRLGAMGYRCHRLDAGTDRLVPVGVDDVDEDNYVFVHDDRRDRVAALLG